MRIRVSFMIIVLILVGCAEKSDPIPTPSITRSPTFTFTPVPTFTPTVSPQVRITPTLTDFQWAVTMDAEYERLMKLEPIELFTVCRFTLNLHGLELQFLFDGENLMVESKQGIEFEIIRNPRYPGQTFVIANKEAILVAEEGDDVMKIYTDYNINLQIGNSA